MTIQKLQDQDARDLITTTGLEQTLFVEAGAGTGKTSALVERIVNLVSSGAVPLRSIAAITFTEAAATELRDRVRERLERAHLGDALEDVDLAAISTLHGFAQRILTEYPIGVGLPPHVEVLDEVQSQLAFDDRWRAFVGDLFDDPSCEAALLRARALGITFDGYQGKSLRTVARVFDDNWDRLERYSQTQVSLAPLNLQPLRELFDQLASLISKHFTGSDDKLAEAIEVAIGWFANIEGADNELDQIRLLGNVPVNNRKIGSGKNWTDVESVLELYRDVRAKAEEILAELADNTIRWLSVRIARLTLDAATARREEGRLEFHDLLVLARRLLRTDPAARQALGNRYQRLLLDEFQDTDPIQIELAVLLAASKVASADPSSWQEVETDPGRLFFVGDPKQSIYRFRRADIGLYQEARQTFGDSEKPTALVQNFRTVPPVLDFVNAVFAQIMDGTVDESQQPAYHPLAPARECSPEGNHLPIAFGDAADKGTKAVELRAQEASDVAKGIAHIINDADQWPVFDRKAATWRPARLSDIAILIPTRAPLTFLESSLERLNIPFRIDTGSLIYETQEVKDLLATLAAIDDSTDSISLVAALRSPLFGCSDRDLAEWVRDGGSFDYFSRYPATLGSEHRVAAALHWFAEAARDRSWSTAAEVLALVISERQAMAFGCIDNRPRDSWNRVRFLQDQARLFTESTGGDLRQFMRWTDLQRHDGIRVHEPRAEEPDDEAVRILTIHGSKGLEFPIVFVAGMSAETKPRFGVRVSFRSDDTPEISLRKGQQTAQFDTQIGLDDQMDFFEKQRLLYVALTRARDYLWVSQHHPTRADGTPKQSYASELANAIKATSAQLCRRIDLPEEPTPIKSPAAPSLAIATSEERDRFIHDRKAALAAQSARRVWSATAIAQEVASAADDTSRPEPDKDPLERGIEEQTTAQDAPFELGHRPAAGYWRQGRAGSAFGSAVHNVLQWLDLTETESDQGIADLASAACLAEAIPDQTSTVAAAVRRALKSDAIQAIAHATRHFKELYVAQSVGERSIEGYVDLLIENGEELTVIDYKTDAVSSEAEVEAKLNRYRLQGATYALALEEATGKAVAACGFVFTSVSASDGEAALTRWIDDLDNAKAEVRGFLEQN